MKFTKMHGLGNDYIYINCFEETVEGPSQLAKDLSDRHFGIGGDGLILICPSEVGHGKMIMYNADGSRGEMCGNGIRCVGKYLYDHQIAPYEEVKIETDAGLLSLQLKIQNGKATGATVNMGVPEFDPPKIPLNLSIHSDPSKITIQGREWDIFCVSMGNPHCILLWDDLDNLAISDLGPDFESHPLFPHRTNVEFTKVLSPREIQFRVWERGSGETLACGTGACAVAVACHKMGLTERTVTLHLLGGDLEIEWADDGSVYMTGPATEVFSGEIADC